jgi:hypothetical protein
MKGYITHIEEATVKNSLYRQVLFAAKNSQLVVMILSISYLAETGTLKQTAT